MRTVTWACVARQSGLPDTSRILLKGISVQALAAWEQHMQIGRRMGQQNIISLICVIGLW